MKNKPAPLMPEITRVLYMYILKYGYRVVECKQKGNWFYLLIGPETHNTKVMQINLGPRNTFHAELAV